MPAVLQDGRMGHFDGSVQARYFHITPVMRLQFLVQLTTRWDAVLDARLAMASGPGPAPGGSPEGGRE